MAKAVEAANAIIEAPADALPVNEHGERLNEGSLEGLVLQRDTVRLAQRELDAKGADVDLKLLRLGNEAAQGLNRLAIRVIEGKFQQQKTDVMVRLLEMLEAKQAVKAADPALEKK